MAKLTLKCGAVVIVDDEVLPELTRFSWALDGSGYAARKTTINKRHGRSVIMHRVIMKAKEGETVDHINQNKLDNRLVNLRISSMAENMRNRPKQKGCTSKFKGVVWHKKSSKWQAQIRFETKTHYLGIFETEDEAGHAYNKAAILYHADFAVLNPIGNAKTQQQAA